LTNLINYTGDLDCNKYIDVINENLNLQTDVLGISDDFTIVEDPHPADTGRLTQQYLHSESIKQIVTPGASPDLNICENIFINLREEYLKINLVLETWNN